MPRPRRPLGLAAALALAALPAAAQDGATSIPHEEGADAPRPPGVVPGCGTYAVLGSPRTLDEAFALQDALGAAEAGVLATSEVAGFAPGRHAVVLGPYGDPGLAQARVAEWRDRVPDAYARYGCVAGVERRPGGVAPGAPLPLLTGVYVAEGLACEDPPNAGWRRYDGRGLDGPASLGCALDLRIAGDGTRRGTNACTDPYDGARRAAAVTIDVQAVDRFALVEDGVAEGAFRLCPALDPAGFGG